MSKSVLFAGNSTTQSVASTSGVVIDFGSVIRRYGCNVGLSGGNATVEGYGYYDVDVNVTFEALTAGDVVVQLYKDGTAIPTAIQSVTVTADSTYSLNVPAIIRQICCCEATITAVISGATGNVTNASIIVEKM